MVVDTRKTDRAHDKQEARGAAAPDRRRKMVAKGATVAGRSRVAANMVRLSFRTDADLSVVDTTDAYVKLLFVPEEADYAWPFTMQDVMTQQPGHLRPIRRTYTLRNIDATAGTFDIDFLYHGESGLAGRWAGTVEPGTHIGFLGPGGGWRPEAEFSHFVLAGDEAAAPAIGEALAALPEGASAQVFVEVESSQHRFELLIGEELEKKLGDRVALYWVERDGTTPGVKLVEALRTAQYPDKETSWFVHGVAEMVKDVRRLLFVDKQVAKERASISGYWRLGETEDVWQATKRTLLEEWEAQESAEEN